VRNTHLLAGARRALRTSTDQTTPLVVLTEVWPKYDKSSTLGTVKVPLAFKSAASEPTKPKDGGGINAP
jgi:hypothetical protein